MFDATSGRVAIDTPAGFSIFEIGSGTFSEGDLVSWKPDAPTGAHLVVNQSSGENCRGYFLNHRVPAALLKANL